MSFSSFLFLKMSNFTPDTLIFLRSTRKRNIQLNKKKRQCVFCFFFFFFFMTNTSNYSPFLFSCLLFRRCSLSFRNLLSCHTVSRVCHCQSHSDEQSANIDYENFKTFGCSLGNIIKSYFVCMQDKNETVRNNTFLPYISKELICPLSFKGNTNERGSEREKKVT